MKKAFLIALSAVVTLTLVVSCKGDDEVENTEEWEEIWTVASTRAEIYDEGNYFWVKIDDADTWQLHDSYVEGFEHSLGYEYVIKVNVKMREELLQDASDRTYTLISILSEEQKDSGTPTVEIWNIASSTVTVDDVLYYWIKTDDEEEWTLFPTVIEGFNYEEGYEYLIHVSILKATDSEGNEVNTYSMFYDTPIWSEEVESDVPVI